MRPAPAGARRELSPEKLPVSVEPAACFEERHEQQPRGVQERNRPPCLRGRGTHGGVRQRCHTPLKLTVESRTERVAPQGLAPACVHHQVRPLRRTNERAEGLGVTRPKLRAVHNQRGDSPRPSRRRGADG